MTNDITSALGKFNSIGNKTESSSKLSSLWLKIEKHKKRNANFSKKINLFFDKFKLTALPYEEKQAELLAEQVEHLIAFISKKSLSDNQREELLEWISSDIDFLTSHPFANNIDVESLRYKVNEELVRLSKSINITVDDDAIEELELMLDDMFDGEMQLEREELVELLKNPSLLEQHIKNFCETMDEEQYFDDKQEEAFQQAFNEAFEDDEFYHEGSDYFQDHRGKKDLDALEKLFKGSQLNKMYKRLASKLHPDKESDDEKKLLKHDLMQQLAKARENKDVFTLLTLYHEHIDDDSFNFDAETITAVESLLTQKVAELNEELRELKSSQTPENVTWNHFKGRSNKITEQNINNHIKELKEESDAISQSISDTQTVKSLKKVLSARINERYASPFFNFDDNLDDFLDVPF